MLRIAFCLAITIFTSLLAWSDSVNKDFLLKSEYELLKLSDSFTYIFLDVPDLVPNFPNVLNEPNSKIEFSEDFWISLYKWAFMCGYTAKQAEEFAWTQWDGFVSFYFDEAMPFVMTPKMQEAIDDSIHARIWVDSLLELKKIKLVFCSKEGNIKTDEAEQLWRPIAKYNGFNLQEIKDDINRHRVTIEQLRMKPEDVLDLYHISPTESGYRLLFRWLEHNMIKVKKFRSTNNKTTA